MRWLRSVYDGELCYHAKKIVTEALRVTIAHAYLQAKARGETHGWMNIKKEIYAEAETLEVRAALADLLTEVRTDGTDLLQWAQTVLIAGADVLLLLKRELGSGHRKTFVSILQKSMKQ